MNKDEIKKALRIHASKIGTCAECSYFGELACSGKLCNDALDLITEQENEIEQLKDSYARVQEQFAKYQIASDKEIKAQQKQGQIDVLTELREQSVHCDQWNCKVVPIDYIDQMIEEIRK